MLRWLGVESATGSFGHTVSKKRVVGPSTEPSQDSSENESDSSSVTIFASDVIGRNVRAEPDSLVAGMLDRGRALLETVDAFGDTTFGKPIKQLVDIFLVGIGQKLVEEFNQDEKEARLREAMGEERYKQSQNTPYSRSSQRPKPRTT